MSRNNTVFLKICLCMLCLITLVSCDYKLYSDNQIVHGTSIIKTDNCIYYFDREANWSISEDDAIKYQNLYKYDIQTGVSEKIDSNQYIGDMYLIDGKLYYLCANFKNTPKDLDAKEKNIGFRVHSYDGKKMTDEGSVDIDYSLDDGMVKSELLPIRRFTYNGGKISKLNNNLILQYNNQVYLQNGGYFKAVSDNVTSFSISNNEIYYSYGVNIYKKADFKNMNIGKVLISEDEIRNLESVKNIFNDCSLIIKDITVTNEYMYFLVTEENTGHGYPYKYSFAEKTLMPVSEIKECTDHMIYNEPNLFFYNISQKNMFIKYGDNNPIDVNPKDFIDKTSNVESFDVFEKTIYFSIRNEDDTLTYYKINDGKASILFE